MLYYLCTAYETRTQKPLTEPEVVSIVPPMSGCTKFLNQQIVNTKFQSLIEQRSEEDRAYRNKFVAIDWYVRSVQITKEEADERQAVEV